MVKKIITLIITSFLEPHHYVPLKKELLEADEEEIPLHPYTPYFPEEDEDKPFEHKGSHLNHLTILLVLIIMCLVLLIGFSIALKILCHKRKKTYLYANGRSVMTFSNPNYYTSNNEVPPPPQPTDKKSFLWKRLKYDKSQVKFLFIIVIVQFTPIPRFTHYFFYAISESLLMNSLAWRSRSSFGYRTNCSNLPLGASCLCIEWLWVSWY